MGSCVAAANSMTLARAWDLTLGSDLWASSSSSALGDHGLDEFRHLGDLPPRPELVASGSRKTRRSSSSPASLRFFFFIRAASAAGLWRVDSFWML